MNHDMKMDHAVSDEKLETVAGGGGVAVRSLPDNIIDNPFNNSCASYVCINCGGTLGKHVVGCNSSPRGRDRCDSCKYIALYDAKYDGMLDCCTFGTASSGSTGNTRRGGRRD